MEHEDTEPEESVEILPFHAINDFMRDDYRLEVVRSTLAALPDLPEALQNRVAGLTRRLATVPGFRNTDRAPLAKRVRPVAKAFLSSPELVAALLAAWSEAHAGLRRRMFDLLSERGWELLPEDIDRSQLPGFFADWPSEDDFEVLAAAYAAGYPEDAADADDISLITVWLSVCLPYHAHTHDEDDAELVDSGDAGDDGADA